MIASTQPTKENQMIEVTGNIIVHHQDREDRANIDAHTRAVVNRLIADQNNPDGDL